MPSHIDKAKSWYSKGKLTQEVEGLTSLLKRYDFSGDDIARCIDHLIPLLAITAQRRLNRNPTLPDYQRIFQLYIRNRWKIVEVCMQVVANQQLSADERKANLERKLLNRKWSNQNGNNDRL